MCSRCDVGTIEQLPVGWAGVCEHEASRCRSRACEIEQSEGVRWARLHRAVVYHRGVPLHVVHPSRLVRAAFARWLSKAYHTSPS